MMSRRSLLMEKPEKFFLLHSRGFVHSEAQQRRAVKRIRMWWYFPIRFLPDMPERSVSGDWLIMQLSRSLNWMEDWFTRQEHWEDKRYGMGKIIREERSQAAFILY